jgi:hypothetical protein
MTNDTRKVLASFVSDLVDQKAISTEVISYEGNAWRVKRTFFGVPAGATYDQAKKSELVAGIVDGLMTHYGAHLKSA